MNEYDPRHHATKFVPMDAREAASLCLEYIKERANLVHETSEQVKMSLRLIHTWSEVALETLAKDG